MAHFVAAFWRWQVLHLSSVGWVDVRNPALAENIVGFDCWVSAKLQPYLVVQDSFQRRNMGTIKTGLITTITGAQS
jgi:hypothetical protein